MLNKKIAHIVSSLEIGGAERFVIDLCQEQRTLGLRPSIISFGSESDKLVAVCESLSIDIHIITGNRFAKYCKVFSLINHFQIFHFHSPYPLKFIAPIFWLKKPQKIIYTRHGANPLASSHWKKLHKYIEEKIDAITFVSQEGADVFRANHGWYDKRLEVIDNGVNIKSIKLNGHNSDKLRLGSVGRMVELKHQVSLLQAVSLLTEEEQGQLEINFFGDGPCEKLLKDYTLKNLHHTTIKFHGMVSDRNTIYGNIDALVVTSETEGLSLAIIESMAFGCLTIGTNVGGNPKLIDNDVNGWLFEFNDIKLLASCIKRLLIQPELLTVMGEDAHKKMVKQFSLEASAKKYLLLYD